MVLHDLTTIAPKDCLINFEAVIPLTCHIPTITTVIGIAQQDHPKWYRFEAHNYAP